MAYAKTFIQDYLNAQETFSPPSINYIIYNLKNKKFRSSTIPNIHENDHLVQILSTDEEFIIFISHPKDDEYFFIELATDENCEDRIYEYYNFYDIEKNEIEISQEYCIFTDCNGNLFNITSTKFATNKNIDSFNIVHFKKEY